jgi:hypothetical protein
MKRFRLRLSSLLWLVAVAAAFLAGIRYGEYRAAAPPRLQVVLSPLSPTEVAKLKSVKSP